MEHQYDYVIVGAGSAGAVLAARLCEHPATTVLLLEAGPDWHSADAPPEMRSANPLGICNVDRFADFQWPQLMARRAQAQKPRRYDRGRGLGGSSAINWMVAHRAELADFDSWAEQGCVGWSGEELLPAMNRLEHDLDFGDASYHGRSGPVTISRPALARWGKVDLALLQAGLELGHPWCPDLNAPGATGIAALPANRTDDNRCSTNDCYLEPTRDRPNLTIRGNVQVDRVLLDGTRATGVHAITADGSAAFRGREVILSAGSVFSPTILLRSGIGPAEDLRALGLPVVADLPVGHNLRDHAAVGIRLRLRPEARATSWHDRLVNCSIRYSSGMCGASHNDINFGCTNQAGYDAAGLASGGIGVALWQTFSHGRLWLTDTDPFAMPAIDENMLSDERDLVRLRDGAKRLFEIAHHPAVRAISEAITRSQGGMEVAVPHPQEIVDGHTLDAWLLETVSDTWHLVGTCRMGAPDDPRSVVDPDCRVIGIASLRVIDGSIMPEVTRANTHLSIMAIAEHMAARLRSGSAPRS